MLLLTLLYRFPLPDSSNEPNNEILTAGGSNLITPSRDTVDVLPPNRICTESMELRYSCPTPGILSAYSPHTLVMHSAYCQQGDTLPVDGGGRWGMAGGVWRI